MSSPLKVEEILLERFFYDVIFADSIQAIESAFGMLSKGLVDVPIPMVKINLSSS